MAAATDGVLSPITTFSKKFIGLVAVLGIVALVMLEAVIHQLRYGLVVTDLASWGTQEGVTWGIYIGTFEWFAGMAVGCIAVVGFIRYRELDRYDVIARIGEIWGLISGLSAAYLIVIDLGRPDRVLNVLTAWIVTVQYSPLAWDVTFITGLLTLTSTMLILSLRRDFSGMELDELPIHAKLLGTVLTAGYQPAEDEKMASMLRWLGLALLILAFTGGMVPGWLLGLVGAQAGYYGALAGIEFLAGGLLTGVAAIALISGIFRVLYGWDDLLPTDVLAGVGKAVTLFGFVYLVVVFNMMLPKLFPMAPLSESRIGEAMIYGHFSTDFQIALAAIAIPVVILTVFRERMLVSGVGLAAVSAPIVWAVFVKSQLVVIEPLLHPTGLPYEVGSYVPTLVEWAIVVGSIAVAILLFAVATRLVPMSRPPSETTGSTTDATTEVSD